MSFDFLEPFFAFRLLALLLYTVVVKRVTSFTVAIACIIVIECIHVPIELTLLPMFSAADLTLAEWQQLRAVWYGSFLLTDLVVVGAIYAVTKRLHLKLELASKCIMAIFMALAMVQIVTFFSYYLGFRDAIKDYHYVLVRILNWADVAVIGSYCTWCIYQTVKHRTQDTEFE